MPKDEFDPEDPMELCGVGIFTEEDTTEAMTECFIEEFMRLGYNHKQLLALFRNPHYTGMNMVLQNKGEPFIRERIEEAFAKWGRPITWHGLTKDTASDGVSTEPAPCAAPVSLPANPFAECAPLSRPAGTLSPSEGERAGVRGPTVSAPVAVDPMGGEIPQEILEEAAGMSGRADGDRAAASSPCGSGHGGCTCGQRFND